MLNCFKSSQVCLETQVLWEAKCFNILGRRRTLLHRSRQGKIWRAIRYWGGRRCQDILMLALATSIYVWNSHCWRWLLCSSTYGSIQLTIACATQLCCGELIDHFCSVHWLPWLQYSLGNVSHGVSNVLFPWTYWKEWAWECCYYYFKKLGTLL